MKAIALLCLLACPAVYAGTITLGSDSCLASYICSNVPNDAGATVAYVDWAHQYNRLLVSLNGVTYDSGLWMVSTPTNAALYAPDGSVIYATLEFSIVRKPCVREGRATVCPVIVTLNGGTLVTP